MLSKMININSYLLLLAILNQRLFKLEYYAMNFLNENYRLGFMMPEQMIWSKLNQKILVQNKNFILNLI